MPPDPNPQMADQAELAARIRAGDSRAFESLFQFYFARLCTFANYYVRAPDVAEEVVADVFAAIWIHREEWSPRAEVSVYLFAAVRNRARTAYQRFARESAWEDTFAREDLTPGLAAPEPRADLMLEAAERMSALREAVFRLTAAEQVLLHLRWREQRSFAEIAEIVGSSTEAVKKRVQRLLIKIRERLPDYFE